MGSFRRFETRPARPPARTASPRTKIKPTGGHEDGQRILRDILGESTRLGFAIGRVRTHELEHEVRGVAAVAAVAVTLELQAQPTVEPLAAALSEHQGVLEVTSTDLDGGLD